MRHHSSTSQWICVILAAAAVVPVLAQTPPPPVPAPLPPSPGLQPTPARGPKPPAPPIPLGAPVAPVAPIAPVAPVPPPAVTPVPPPEQAVPHEPRTIRVYKLKHADAGDAAKALAGLRTDRRAFMATPDLRTNSLIVSSTREEFKTIEELLEQLDVAVPERRTDRSLEIVQLKYARAEELASALQKLAAPDAVIATDKSSNTVLVQGSESMARMAVEILRQLDTSREVAPRESRRVRIVWLISDMDLPSAPPDMEDVKEELASLGIVNLGLAAQNIVQTVSGGQFRIEAMPTAFANGRVKVEGVLSEKEAGPPQLELLLNASGMLPAAEGQVQPRPPGALAPPGYGPTVGELATIKTTVIAPPGHKVVLGVTPIGKSTSVFVIQMLPGGESRNRPATGKR